MPSTTSPTFTFSYQGIHCRTRDEDEEEEEEYGDEGGRRVGDRRKERGPSSSTSRPRSIATRRKTMMREKM
ncbi:putative eukaryotic translation initiation factor 5A-4 [Iris pallida]|uniref:Eukaryotic translation initiation factor 5A-4 n=1 Tax=Iris pallida TaxID=29817 RepID=A0AAX6HAT7_IRIPA|nr:putative eukaryotic translation initiation factor 5A-4 [Iris pallida]KAJ6837814.1 putative eukaryotic translation initiation factor 5A-4 [Iris pallida]